MLSAHSDQSPLSLPSTVRAHLPHELLQLLPTTGSLLFVFDKDGTLDDSQQIEKAGRLPDETVRTLNTLDSISQSEHLCTVSIVSGRSIRDLSRTTGDLNCRLFGLHGCETRRRNSVEVETIISRPSPIKIDAFYDVLVRGVNEYNLVGKGVEVLKGSAKAEIFWGQSSEHEEVSRKIFSAALNEIDGFSIVEGTSCLEVLAEGAGKGPAVELLIRETQPDFVVCAGNDIPDLQMFQASANGGRPFVNIIVGDGIRFPGAINLNSPNDLLNTLDLYCRAVAKQ